MAHFGETLFGDSPFMRWALTPFLLLFMIVMPLALPRDRPFPVLGLIGLELVPALLLVGLWLRTPWSSWAFRGVAACVFLLYAAYAVSMFFFSDEPLTVSGRRSDASPRNALLGFIVIGLPCLWYALLGRFSLRDNAGDSDWNDDDSLDDDAASGTTGDVPGEAYPPRSS